MGGEKILEPSMGVGNFGSPPRGRGKARDWPAAQHGPRDHPRVGGEKRCPFTPQRPFMGSPPRRRGKATVAVRVNVPVRITPAQAGKSRRGGFCYVWTRDHPRVGGEKPPGTRIQPPSTGSPPRGRGKVTLSYHHPFFFGITPAWAGKRNSVNISPQWN